jgi:hypothetical protein
VFRKKGAIVRTKKYGKLFRISAIMAAIIIASGLIAYAWQEHEDKKYPEGTEMDYSLPNAFLDFARLIHDFVNQNVEEKPEETDLPVSSGTEEKDNIIIVGSGREEEPGTNSEAEQEEPEIRGGIVEKSDSAPEFAFRNSLFVGDYFVYQAQNLGFFKDSAFAYVTGLDMNTMLTKKALKLESGNVILSDYVAAMENVEAVYIVISAESVSWMDVPTFVKKYIAFVESIVAVQPEAHIYIQPILPINEEKTEKRGYSVTNEKINLINEYIVSYALENEIWVLDMAKDFADKSGILPPEYTTNGIRFEKTTYEIWKDYIMTHKSH